MLKFIQSYKDFIYRDMGEIPVPSSFELIPDHKTRALKWFIIFCLISYLTPHVLKCFSFYKKLTLRKKNEWPSYVVCLVHHLRLIPISILQIIEDFNRPSLPMIKGDKIVPKNSFITFLNSLGLPVQNETILLKDTLIPDPQAAYDLSYNLSKSYTYIGSFCLAYLLADTVCFALPSAFPVFFYKLNYNIMLLFKGKKYKKTDEEIKNEIKLLLKPNFEFLFHHLASIILTISALSADGRIARFIPHVLLCEMTGVFFTLAWMIRSVMDIKRGEKVEDDIDEDEAEENKLKKKNKKSYAKKFFIIIINILEKLFVISYLFVRVINLPTCFYSLLTTHKSQGDSFGIYGKLSFVPITLLQWFWFYKVIY